MECVGYGQIQYLLQGFLVHNPICKEKIEVTNVCLTNYNIVNIRSSQVQPQDLFEA